MATVALGKAGVSGTISGNAPQERDYPEGTSLAVVDGELVYLSGGYATEIGANPALILGMANKTGKNTTAGLYNIPVALANGDTIFSANKSNSSGTLVATVVTDVGKELAIYRDTTNNLFTVYLAEGASAALGRAMCIGLDKRDTVGDTGGRLLFMFKGLNRQLFCTS